MIEFEPGWGTRGHLPPTVVFSLPPRSPRPPHPCVAEKGGGIPRSGYLSVDKHRALNVTACPFCFLVDALAGSPKIGF